MRKDVKKFLFIGHHRALDRFFKTAQELGLVHFIKREGERRIEVSKEIEDTVTAIKVVRELPPPDVQLEPTEEIDANRLISEILALRHSLEGLQEKRRTTALEIARTEMFGDFSLKDLSVLEEEGNRILQFFSAKKGSFELENLPNGLIYIDSRHGLDYFVSVNDRRMHYPGMIEMKIDEELGELKQKVREIDRQLEEVESKLKTYAKYNTFLHHALVEKSNRFNLEAAQALAEKRENGQLFAVEGWVPKEKLGRLEKHLKSLDVDIFEIAVEEGETIPTYLENKGMARVGEDLVHIYDTPSSGDKDPSIWVLFSFALFFAMIINDGGYGLVFLAAALYLRYKKPNLGTVGKRVWKLSVLLFSFCIVWGIFTNAFFSIHLDPQTPLTRASVLNWLVEKKAAYHISREDAVYSDWLEKYPHLQEVESQREFLLGVRKEKNGVVKYEMYSRMSDGILMELALVVGIIHISLSLLRYSRRNFAAFGWVLAIIGCYFYLPVMLKASTLMHYVFGFDKEFLALEGKYFIVIGLSLAIVLAIVQNGLLGLLEIPNVIQIFADILSYLRLYALGLAGSIISATVNEMADSIFFVGALVLLIIGHGLNMTLSLIGGVIHGLRLNFIEWYHYSFEGGGKPFNPLRKLEVE